MMEIDKFIKERIKSEYQQIYQQFRVLISKEFPFLKEEMRGGTEKYYGIPVYRYHKIIISVSPTQKGITFAFSEGKKFEDKYALLEGKGNKSLNLRISATEDYSAEILRYYIEQAINLDK